MASWLVLSEEERNVDPQLGYPRGYAKLCRHAHAWVHSNIFPYSEGPPRKFIPYALPPDDIAKLKDFENLFPVIGDDLRDTLNVQRYAEMLWRQLDHLGNAGFDPAKFRVDAYGNVLYWHADPASPLAWEVAHWFPHSRGGKSVLNNLRIVQWQVSLRKRNRLEFLVPWWDLQLVVSVNHFLSAFASTNVEFRRRCFSYLFQSGEDEQISDDHVVENHHWPHHFLERKSRWGLAAAALVRQQKDVDEVLRSLNGPRPGSGYASNITSDSLNQKRWNVEEEQVLKRAVQKFGFGSWKEMKDCEPGLVHRSTLQIRDKCRSMREDGEETDKENMTSVLQKEVRLKKLREEKEEKSAEVTILEEKLKAIKEQNEKEKEALETLECMLMQQRKQVEKQQQWNETQASYRLCLERMVHETMHQSVIYKEEARLNQAACNSLMAQLDSLTAACGAAEVDFLKRSKQREALLSLIHKNLSDTGKALDKANILPSSEALIEAGHSIAKLDHNSNTRSSTSRRRSSGKRHRLRVDGDKCSRMKIDDGSTSADLMTMQKEEQDAKRSKPEYRTHDPKAIIAAEEEAAKTRSSEAAISRREAVQGGRDPTASQMIFETSLENNTVQLGEGNETVMEDAQKPDLSNPEMEAMPRKSEEDQLDDLLEEVLVRQGKLDESYEREEDVNEEEKVRRLGKHTLDKWLQLLLVSPAELAEKDKGKSKIDEQDGNILQLASMGEEVNQKHEQNEIVEILERCNELETERSRLNVHDRLADEHNELQNMNISDTHEFTEKNHHVDKHKKPLGGLFRKLSVRHQPSEHRFVKRNVPDDAESTASGDCETITTKMAAMKIESSKPKETEATMTKIIKRAISPFSRRKSLKPDAAISQNGFPSSQKENSQPAASRPIHQPAAFADTKKLDPKQQASIRSCAQASRKAYVNECAETWKNEVRRLETRKNHRQY